jgi:CDP-4-dehydro-6-deoxyglucose reductase, E3
MTRVSEAFQAEVLSCDQLAPRVSRLVLGRCDRRPMDFQPGQWLKVFLPTPAGEIHRAYSIASPPDESSQFELAVTAVEGGPGSNYLCGLVPGSIVRVHGPHGVFTRPPTENSPALLVGTGTGVTPLRSMLRAALGARSPAPLWLLLGARHEEGLLYRAEFDDLARQHSHVRVFYTLSRPLETWKGLQGYVQVHIPALWEELVALGRAEPHLFVCGLECMVSVVRSLARKTMGLPRERVHSERYD